MLQVSAQRLSAKKESLNVPVRIVLVSLQVLKLTYKGLNLVKIIVTCDHELVHKI